MRPDDILRFWFEQIAPEQWWQADAALDARIRERFGAVHAAAARAELFHWRAHPDGRLAEIVVLDQFSRNIHRGSAAAFACDPMALVLAQEAVARGVDRELPPERRAFLYMPYMHSESLVIHEEALRLFGQPGLEHSLAFELGHRRVLQRFGRYPQRNAALGRASTPEERAFLEAGIGWLDVPSETGE
jgi:uncharacterized protein (DUF924 family)